jgi:cyclohexyl-isocyanide hydratase
MVLFPNLTHLDLAGPFEVFGRISGATVRAVAATREPVRSDTGLAWLPDLTFAEAPAFDVICVPGGPGVNPAMEDEATLRWLAAQAVGARFVTSVCTGSLVLGAAGLLRGYRATTHWMSHDFLPLLGATPVAERVVVDHDRITGGGVTAGIDFGLTVAAALAGVESAKRIQLMLEYDPAPPFDAGSPTRADAATVAAVRAGSAPYFDARLAIVRRAAARLGLPT